MQFLLESASNMISKMVRHIVVGLEVPEIFRGKD
jgi:hypothetical protein